MMQKKIKFTKFQVEPFCDEHRNVSMIDPNKIEKSVRLRVDKKQQRQDNGATLIEYAVLVGLIVIIALASISLIGQRVSQQFSTLADSF